ncbi:pectate lyase superfamily protein-domain-containing protein [Aspergillus foveolatus]|uniref:pectate lyase superfamily protein-domain-containing protein n=1 Tax=Aspergillus foveolatus TaxID=210207 RepID=UPI003CCD7036
MRLFKVPRTGFQTLSACLVILTFLLISTARADHSHHHHHDHHDRRSNQPHVPRNVTDADSPEAMLKNALAVLAHVNKQRVEHPNFNNYTSRKPDETKVSSTAATPLPYSADAAKHAQLRRRDDSTEPQQGNKPYYIPAELARAASIVAESTRQTPTGNHSDVAEMMRQKYGQNKRQTNTPPQSLLRSNGLYDFQSYTGPTDTMNSDEDIDSQSGLAKRAPSKYWMPHMNKNGYSPYAPDGYKVWRNVRDYGAKGDGVTDDTAAINRAISDGGRCGEDCGSSTRYPAVVWFPGGKYLVSSSIIQYYNTQFIGDPMNVPTILAASSFVGLGVITSDPYVGDNAQWYLNQNNFLRSIKNFKIDIRLTDPSAYVCAIHWQVAQGSSLENIEFYMLYNSDVPTNTQQGIYMENGSGGFLADLTFVGGNFGAYFGNQQFTTSQLVFVNCNTALQVHWDWAWTMQDYVIESCINGLTIVGGAGGSMGTGQGVGSLILADAIIANTPNGIITSLHAENSTSLLLHNVGFFNVETAVVDSVKNKVLLAGGDEVLKDSWGFGTVTNASGASSFVDGSDIPVMNRTEGMTGTQAYVKPNWFTRRRPQYEDLAAEDIVNVKLFGVKGDGTSDDTVMLNWVLSYAANLSSVVYFPYGIYIITDTLDVPVGSRIVGQAWPQIMATGSKFEDIDKPHVAVKIGDPGDVGIIEIQDLLFTASGPTAGAILVQWNVKQSSKGSAAMWDSHFRIGGAVGTNLQKEQCPKETGRVNLGCIAASLLLHLAPTSTPYLENIWVWVADHDLDVITQDQIDVYSARGILIESKKAWLYGTSSEHNVLYQYQLSEAENILMAMIQTESPYYQPVPLAPAPFTPGAFPNDPTFNNCKDDPMMCAVSWAVRIIDSSSIWVLGTGLYSFYSAYSQDCLDTNDCQQHGLEIEQSHSIWIHNLCTKAIIEMVSPFNGVPTYARDNVNGFLSSVLAWLGGAEQTAGERDFPGFSIYNTESLEKNDLPSLCVTALTALIKCNPYVRGMTRAEYHGSPGDDELTESVCDPSCGDSLQEWFDSVQRSCAGYTLSRGSPPVMFGGRMWAGYNETCSKDETTGEYCNTIIDNFTIVDSLEQMPKDEICSYCFVKRHQMMQQSPYSPYDEYYQSVLEAINTRCGLSGPTEIKEVPLNPLPTEEALCLSDVTYTTADGDTCTSIAKATSVSSAALYMGNQDIIQWCSSIKPGLELCLPLSCKETYELQPSDTCSSIEYAFELGQGDLRKYNPWVSYDCANIHIASEIYGTILCLSPQGGEHVNDHDGTGTAPSPSNGYADAIVAPPADASVAEETTMNCGRWHEAQDSESCVAICLQGSITHDLFVAVNPSLDPDDCAASLQVGKTYCTGPIEFWDALDDEEVDEDVFTG